MVTLISDVIGKGLYTPQEAAFYSRVNTSLITRWVFGNQTGQPVITREYSGDDKVVSFLDFVQALSIRAIRIRYQIPLPRIREAVNRARDKFGIPYPFAVKHRTFLFGDVVHASSKAQIVIKISDDVNDIVQLTGDAAGNRVLKEVAEVHMEDLCFDDDDVAKSYTSFRWKDRDIVMDPHRQFGEPLVSNTGYSARALWDAYEAEGSVDRAAEEYGVDRDDIVLALRYLDHLRGTAKAKE